MRIDIVLSGASDIMIIVEEKLTEPYWPSRAIPDTMSHHGPYDVHEKMNKKQFYNFVSSRSLSLLYVKGLGYKKSEKKFFSGLAEHLKICPSISVLVLMSEICDLSGLVVNNNTEKLVLSINRKTDIKKLRTNLLSSPTERVKLYIYAKISEKKVKYLAEAVHQKKELHLPCTFFIGPVAPFILPTLTNLQTLKINHTVGLIGTQIMEDFIDSIGRLRQLTYLELSHIPHSGATFKHLMVTLASQRLTTLKLKNLFIEHTGYDFLSFVASLPVEVLSLHFAHCCRRPLIFSVSPTVKKLSIREIKHVKTDSGYWSYDLESRSIVGCLRNVPSITSLSLNLGWDGESMRDLKELLDPDPCYSHAPRNLQEFKMKFSIASTLSEEDIILFNSLSSDTLQRISVQLHDIGQIIPYAQILSFPMACPLLHSLHLHVGEKGRTEETGEKMAEMVIRHRKLTYLWITSQYNILQDDPYLRNSVEVNRKKLRLLSFFVRFHSVEGLISLLPFELLEMISYQWIT